MTVFFAANLIIAAGGILALLTWQQFNFMKTVSVLALVSGCLLGGIDAVTKLMHPGEFNAAVVFMKASSLTFRIDPLSAFFLMAIYAISLLAALYSFHYLNNPEKSLATAANTLFFSLLIVSMALVVTADNILAFMLSWECMSLSSFFLVIYDHQSSENRRAGFLYFVFSQVGAMFILAGFALIYNQTGSLAFSAAILSVPLKTTVFVLCFIGFGSKAGIFPFHVWLPHAHPAAPSHISAVMSGVMIKTGIYGIVRIYSLLELHTLLPGQLVLITGMVTGILGVVYALGQHDLKRLLAYSSVENIGIILIGIGIGMIGVSTGHPMMAVLGFAGGLLHVLNHSIFKSLLFMGAGVVIQKAGTRTIDALGGLIKPMRVTGASFLIGSLAISGLPPFNGFVSEFLVYLGGFRGVALNQATFVMSILAIVSLAVIGGLALALFSKVMGVVFQGEPRTTAASAVDERGNSMRFSLVILAAACAVVGVFPRFFVVLTLQGLSALELGGDRMALEPFLQITTNISLAAALFLGILILIVAFRTLAYKGKSITRSGTWGCGFTQPTVKMQYTGSSYAASILDFFKPVAPLQEDHPVIRGRFPQTTHYRSRIDDIAERHMGRVIVRPVLGLFDSLRWIQHGDIHLYIGYILAAIVALLFFV
ncbi:MAG: proton-conducting transporter membrane subunit [Desulfobacterales bacterium]|jgi:hydrogenase-4 component B